ncbi:MAG TPA: ribosome silencing factor [Gammaproteobacteria bacterium]
MPRKAEQQSIDRLTEIVDAVLDDLKAEAIVRLDVRHLTTVTDVMYIATGRSNRHVRAVAHALIERCKENGISPLGVEGQDSGEWVLIDLADVVVHVMLPKIREFYDLEKLWDLEDVGDAGRTS